MEYEIMTDTSSRLQLWNNISADIEANTSNTASTNLVFWVILIIVVILILLIVPIAILIFILAIRRGKR